MSPSPFAVTSSTEPASYSWEATDEGVAERFGIPVEQVLRFDLNTSPAPPAIARAAPRQAASRPACPSTRPGDYRRLVEAAASVYGVTTDEVVPGAGADEILDMCTKAFLPADEAAVISTPTYAMYRVLAEQRGGRVIDVPRRPAAEGWAMDTSAVRAAAREATLVWICNPNNPTGLPEPEGAIEALLSGLQTDAAADGRAAPAVVVDEAYGEFTGDSVIPLRTRFPNLVAVRTASKAYAMAGLRVGFAVAAPATLRRVALYRPPGSVGTISATVVAAALRDGSEMRTNVDRVERERPRLAAGLAAAGWRPEPSVTNFVLLDLVTAEAVRGRGPRPDAPGPRPAHVRARPPPRPLPPRDRARPRRERPPDRGRPRRSPPRSPPSRRSLPHDHAPRHPRHPRARRPARPRRAPHARDGHRRSLSISTAPAPTAIATGIGFYDHLLGSLAHHGLFDLEIRATGDLHVDEHHTVEDVALVLGAAFAEALGDRAGIRRFGDSSVPMDESVATAVIDVGGRPYAVIDLPFRAERAGALPLQLVDHALEVVRRAPRAPRSTCAATGRNDHHLARGRVQGARPRAPRRPASRIRAAPASRPPRGRSGDDRLGAPRVVVVDYGAGNLVSIEQALTRRGRPRPAAPLTGDEIDDPDLLVVPGRRRGRAGHGAPARRRLRRARSAPGSPPIARSWGSASASSCCSRAATRTARRRSASCPAGRSGSRARRRCPHIGWNQVRPPTVPSGVRGHRRRRGLLLRPLLRRGARRAGRRRR